MFSKLLNLNLIIGAADSITAIREDVKRLSAQSTFKPHNLEDLKACNKEFLIGTGVHLCVCVGNCGGVHCRLPFGVVRFGLRG